MAEADPNGTHLGGIASGLVNDVQDLFRGELALARVEFDHKLRGLAVSLVSVVAGALLAFAGLVVLLHGLAAVLAQWMPAWAALLTVGVAVVVIGGLMGRAAFSRLSVKSLAPERTIENVQSDAKMIKEHA